MFYGFFLDIKSNTGRIFMATCQHVRTCDGFLLINFSTTNVIPNRKRWTRFMSFSQQFNFRTMQMTETKMNGKRPRTHKKKRIVMSSRQNRWFYLEAHVPADWSGEIGENGRINCMWTLEGLFKPTPMFSIDCLSPENTTTEL